MFKGLIKISVFAVLGIAGCTNSQDAGSIKDSKFDRETESAQERFLSSFEYSKSPDFAEHISQLNTVELHDYAENLNWDYGIGRVFAILNNPEVDRGTALMLYWRNQPYHHAKYKTKKEASKVNLKGYELHLEAERILLNRNFKTYDYPFNFIRDSFFCPEHAKRALADKRIPQELKVMDGPNMTKHMKDWCSSDERIRAEKWRADNGIFYPYEDPYADEKISEVDRE